ncbi:unnamed protein product [Caenorhabditis auriculariae]|uniref:Uncharacterized protein n=1 Tax=Caenorhabditis auriculariae TaxID=2777116 RepID=A0A8S1HJD7_9PELO|nr:unnamed protein product [Caenorhabditis auriculariae]
MGQYLSTPAAPSAAPSAAAPPEKKTEVKAGTVSESTQQPPPSNTGSILAGPTASPAKTQTPKSAVMPPASPKPVFIPPADTRKKANTFDANYDTLAMMPDVDWKRSEKSSK